jgi:hypothetical protein
MSDSKLEAASCIYSGWLRGFSRDRLSESNTEPLRGMGSVYRQMLVELTYCMQ